MGVNLFDIQAAYQSIEVKNAAGNALSIDASGFLTVKGDGNFTVTATDLDIRDLTQADEITSYQGGTWNVVATATDLDIRDLAFASDSVTAYQGGSWSIVSNQGGYASWKVTTESVTSTESELMATPLTGRLSMLVQNIGDKDVYVKEATGVSTSNGLKIPKGGYFEADLDDGANIFAITASGTADLRCVEYAA